MFCIELLDVCRSTISAFLCMIVFVVVIVLAELTRTARGRGTAGDTRIPNTDHRMLNEMCKIINLCNIFRIFVCFVFNGICVHFIAARFVFCSAFRIAILCRLLFLAYNRVSESWQQKIGISMRIVFFEM